MSVFSDLTSHLNWTGARDFITGSAAGFPMPGQRQAVQDLIRHPNEAAPSWVLRHDEATPGDNLAFGTDFSKYRALRNIGRGVGLGFGAFYGGEALGGLGSGSEAGAEGGTGTAATGLGDPYGGAYDPAAFSGDPGTTVPTGGMSLSDYLQRYGRQGTNLLSSMGGQNQNGGVPGQVRTDNPMIAPYQSPSFESTYSSNDLNNLDLMNLLNNMNSSGYYPS